VNIIIIPNFIRTLFIGITAVVTSCFLGACSDEEAPTVAEIVTQDWRVTAISLSGNSQSITGQKVVFHSSGNYIIQVNYMEVPETGVWTLDNSETRIILNSGDDVITILDVSETQMELLYEQQNYKSEVVTFRITLERN